MTKKRRVWVSENFRHLRAELARVRGSVVAAFARLAESTGQNPIPSDSAASESVNLQLPVETADSQTNNASPPFRLVELCEIYELSDFERDVLLVCAGVELESGIYAQLAKSNHGLAACSLAVLSGLSADADLEALLPEGILRRAQLLRFVPGPALADSTLRIEDRVLHYLLGLHTLDERLRHLWRPLRDVPRTFPSQQPLLKTMETLLSDQAGTEGGQVLWLCGPDEAARRAVAAALGQSLGLPMFLLDAADLPSRPRERDELVGLWTREQLLEPAGLLLLLDEQDGPDVQRAAAAFLDRVPGVVVVSSRELVSIGQRPVLRIAVPAPTFLEQVDLFQAALTQHAETESLGADDAARLAYLEQLASCFRLDTQDIDLAVRHAQRLKTSIPGDTQPDALLQDALWQACRERARPQLDELAEVLPPKATWDDLILPDSHLRMLRALTAQQRHRATVYHRWGLGRHSSRGLGVTALFVGQSGTGKTLAAEVVAGALGLDLFRIDLARVVSKYIGETEKNLRRIFDAAEQGGAVLLFDEADALFGKRSEVKDSRDRYANIEVSYLLQRMDSYKGVSILTSNMRSSLDAAFLRRLRFVVQFPFPDRSQRVSLWKLALPDSVPQRGVDFDRLAKLSIAGGHIRNIAMAAAFLAAEDGLPVTMRHLLFATRSEFEKLELPLSEADVSGWNEL